MGKIQTIRKWKVFLWAFLFSFITQMPGYAQRTNAQTRPVSGKVFSKVNGLPVIGASITIKGTRNSVVTNEKGEFTIMASPEEELVFSSIGFLSKTIKAGSLKTTGITLTEDYSKMEDVVIIGYGKMKKTDLSSSQVTVTAADISKTVNATFDQALQGRAANVFVASSNAQPGGAPSVMIRGVNSISSSNQPLYVIDGIQIQPSDPGGGAAGTYNPPAKYGNALSGINPDDIESMNVLQGPAAVGIYGSAGGNGVIVITTKRGKAGDSKISLNTLWSMQDLPKFAPVMKLKQYGVFRNELQKAGGSNSQAEYADPTLLGNGSDWQSALFRRTLLQKHTLSLSGGNEKTTFYLSGEYFNQDGIAQGSGFSRASVRLNLDNNTRKWLKIGTNLSFNTTKEKIVVSNNSLINTAIDNSPAIDIKTPDGSWGGPPIGAPYASNFINPIALAQINTNYNRGVGALGGAYIDITFIKGLVFRNEFNGSYGITNSYIYNPTYTFGGNINNNNFASQNSGNNYWWGVNSRLQYDTRINQHSISVMAAHEAQAWGYEGLFGQGDGFIDNSFHTLNFAAQDKNLITNSSKGGGSKESYFARVNYIFNDRYILQGVYRYDGSSVFGAARRWGSFPSVSAAWKISEEEFMKGVNNLDELKLRVEYGLSGNSGVSSNAQYAVLASIPSVFGAAQIPTNYQNADLQWEADKTTNVGFDLHMFKSRLEVVGDVYLKKSTKLLASTIYPGYFGGGTQQGGLAWPVTNIGAMENKGFGITINTVNITNKDFTWKTGLNFSLDRNKVTSLLRPLNVVYGTNSNNSQAEFLTEVGQPVGMITGYIADGLFQNYQDITGHANQTTNAAVTVDPGTGSWVGDIKFRDVSGANGKPDNVIDQKDRVILGNPWPKYNFGFNNAFSYKGFEMNIFILGSVGNDILNLQRYLNTMPGSKGAFNNYYASVIDFARPSSYNAADALTATLLNPKTNVPRVYTSSANGNNRIKQWDIEKGTYVRVKNISLSYNFPSAWVSKIAMKGLRVSVNAQNLLTITKYTGFDPEIGPFNYWNNANPTVLNGIDNGRYPNTRMYSFNLVADF
ncbi:SusC/RagA family TonB-linked outer membrane protein [Flavitalea flava]